MARSFASAITSMENREEKRQVNDCFFQRGTRSFSAKRATWRQCVSRCVHENVPSIKYKSLFSREKKALAKSGSQAVFHDRILDHEIREEGNFVWNILSSYSSQAERRHFHHRAPPQRGRFIKSIWTIFPAFSAHTSSYVVFIAANIQSRCKNLYCWRGTALAPVKQ